MAINEIDEILKKTLADFRLSRSERQALGKLLDELGAGKRQMDVFRQRAFAVAREELVSPKAVAVVDWLEGVVKLLQPKPPRPQLPAEAYFSPGEDCRRKLIRLLNCAADKVDICVFTITDDRIAEAILKAHRHKVAVRVIADNDKANDPGSDVDRIARSGVAVRLDRSDYHMHHKFALFDGSAVVTGSYNWTRSAADYNEENLIVAHDPRLVQAFSGVFERLWEEFA